MKSIADRSYLVTGAASGIGEAIARLLGSHGAKVTLADVNVEAGETVVRDMHQQGQAAQFVRADISSESDVIAMVAAAVERFGRLDGAVNNAGVPNLGKTLIELSVAEWKRCHEINVMGTFLCLKHEIRQMLGSGGGAIVNTSSVCGLVFVPTTCEYTASKHAVTGLTKAAAAEYGGRNIRVNAFAPSTTRTPLYHKFIEQHPEYLAIVEATHPLRRASEPAEQAEAAVWLLSDSASFVTGVTLPVDGGYTQL